MERYYITNGTQYLGTSGSGFIAGVPSSKAKKFKKELADNILPIVQNKTNEDWCIQKIRNKSSSGSNYVITNATKWVGDNGLVVNELNKAKAFKMAADAESYIRCHGELVLAMGDVTIVNDEYQPVDIYGRKTDVVSIARKIELDHSSEVKKIKRSPLDKNLRLLVYNKYNGICDLCGEPLDTDNFTVDHIVPLNRGGINDISNYRCLCRRCNQFKGDALDGELKKMFWNVGRNYFYKHRDTDMMYEFARMWGKQILERGEEIMKRRSMPNEENYM